MANILSDNLVIYRMFCISGGETLKTYSLMKKLWNFLMVAIMFVASAEAFTACSKDDVGSEDIPTEDLKKKERIARYGNWIDVVVCRQMVDQLDYLFQASAYRDSLLRGSDTEIVIQRQFLNSSYLFNEKGEICWWYDGNENSITHNDISLYEDGAEWTVSSYKWRFWDAPNQPEDVESQWTVRRENGVYTLSGGTIHNGLWEECFTLTEITDLQFTIGRVQVMTMYFKDDNIIFVPKSTRRYCFNGDIDITVIKNKEGIPNPNIKISLEELNGYNAKEYLDGIPIYTAGFTYFTSGKINAGVFDDQEPLHFEVAYGNGPTKYSEL